MARGASRQGHIQPFGAERACHRGLFERICFLIVGSLQGLLDLIGGTPYCPALLFGDAAHLLKHAHDGRIAPQVRGFPLTERLITINFGESSQAAFLNLF